MTQATVPTYVYTVYTTTGCTVTAPGFPAFSVTCSPGMANSFTAPGDTVEISDPAATLVAVRTFNSALAALGLLGGGNTLPAGYTRLEYLEVATRGQYIMPAAVLGDAIEIAFSAEYANDTNRVVGAEYVTTDAPGLAVGIASNGAFFIRVRKEGQSFTYTPAGGHGKTHVVRIGEKAITVNGEVVSAANYKMPELLPVQVSLFAQIVYNADLSFNRTILAWPSTRIYGFRNWRGGILLGNYIPALDPTGAPCMYDLVTRKPFYNAGTGDFVTPQAAARTYSMRGRRVLPDWGKLTENGLRRLYHVPDGYQGDMLQYAAEHGFCPIQEEPQPEEGFWAPKWEEVAGVIYLRWVATAPPEEI